MNKIMNTSPTAFIESELKGLRQVVSYLYDGEQGAFNALIFIKGNYKEWPAILQWLKRNNIYGKKLIQFFQNESTIDGGGYHMGVTYILSRLKGHKHEIVGIKGDELS